MKELYLNAEMDVVEFDAMDVIATSVEEGGEGSETPVVTEEATTTFTPANNEGPPAYNAWS